MQERKKKPFFSVSFSKWNFFLLFFIKSFLSMTSSIWGFEFDIIFQGLSYENMAMNVQLKRSMRGRVFVAWQDFFLLGLLAVLRFSYLLMPWHNLLLIEKAIASIISKWPFFAKVNQTWNFRARTYYINQILLGTHNLKRRRY